LRHYFTERKKQAASIHENYVRLWDAAEATALAGGKRLRPYLFLLTYQAYGGDITPQVIKQSLVWELMHISLLMHDDIIDRDFVRHGSSNAAGIYKVHYQKHLKNSSDVTHFSNSAALLAGDLLLMDAQNIIHESSANSQDAQILGHYFQQAYFEVAGGELIDVESAFLPIGDIDSELINRYKTTSYSFLGPIVSAARLAQAEEDQILKLTNLSELCGYAFQLRDDILGVFGDTETTGKSTSSDIEEGKRTKLLLNSYTKTDAAGRKLLESLGATELANKDIEKVRQIILKTGAKEEVVQLIHNCSTEAKELLNQLTIDDSFKDIYRSLIDRLSGRQN